MSGEQAGVSREDAEAVVVEVLNHAPDEGYGDEEFSWNVIEALFQSNMIVLRGEVPWGGSGM